MVGLVSLGPPYGTIWQRAAARLLPALHGGATESEEFGNAVIGSIPLKTKRI